MTVAENWGGPNLLKNYLYKSKSWEKTQVICNKSPPPPPNLLLSIHVCQIKAIMTGTVRKDDLLGDV